MRNVLPLGYQTPNPGEDLAIDEKIIKGLFAGDCRIR
jgi:hypothetical protein